MGQKGFYINIIDCKGCKACQIACKDKNDLKVGELYRRVYEFEGGLYPNVWGYYLSISCNHCTDAKCIDGCPTGALHYANDGTVQHNPNLCIGCKYCMWNCPYEIPQYLQEKNIIGKCDTCKDLRDAGENPVCVDACPMRCLHFGDLDDLTKEYGPDLVREIPVLPSATRTKPSLLIKPKDSVFEHNYREKGV